MNFIIEGIDRLGKDLLIRKLKNMFGYFLILHHQIPEPLEFYKANNLFLYQKDSFITTMSLLKIAEVQNIKIICNRSWLGENVYSKRYRNYSGEYIFDLEYITGMNLLENTKLILLTTSNFDILKDDGKSLDFTQKEEEQEDFKNTYLRSSIKNKVLIDVHNGIGKFKNPNDILNEVLYE